MAKGPVYIVEHMAEVVAKVNTKLLPKLGKEIYYMYGHPLELVNRLSEMTQSPVHGNKKYPIVLLFTDIPIVKDKVGYYGDARLQIVIANITEPDYDAPKRLETNFKPILQPIKVELLEQLSRHRQFTHEGELQYTEIERYYWGKAGLYGNTGNIFNDFLDCIELQDVLITVKNFIC